MFDDNLNSLIEYNHLTFRAVYLDALKDLCMKQVEKGLSKL